MLFWQTGRGRRAQRRMIAWTRYRHRCDKLSAKQQRDAPFVTHPVRTNPGYCRAEGWDTGPASQFRHGM